MDQEKIRQVISSTGCDEKLAHIILEFTDGDTDKACRIILTIPKDIAVIVSRFSAARAQKHGILVHVWNIKSRRSERTAIIISHEPSATENIDDSDFSALIKKIAGASSRGVPLAEKDMEELAMYIMKEEIQSDIKEILTSEDGLDETANIKLTKLLNGVLFKVFADSELTVKVNVRMIDSFQLNRGDKEIESAEKTAKEKEAAEKKEKDEGLEAEQRVETTRKNDSVIILISQPYISPVKGTPIPKFKIGDFIFADISDPREVGSYLKKLLLETTVREHPEYEGRIAAQIDEIEFSMETENVSVIVRYGPGIYGRLLVSRDLKVDAPGRNQSEDASAKPASSSSWLLWVAVLAFVILILLMAFLKR